MWIDDGKSVPLKPDRKGSSKTTEAHAEMANKYEKFDGSNSVFRFVYYLVPIC